MNEAFIFPVIFHVFAVNPDIDTFAIETNEREPSDIVAVTLGIDLNLFLNLTESEKFVESVIPEPYSIFGVELVDPEEIFLLSGLNVPIGSGADIPPNVP